MHWGNWDAMGDWWWVMALAMTLFWIFVIWVVVRMVGRDRTPSERPEDVLRGRLARGEITEAEYEQLRTALRK
jgi:uncharacterized membrane protein